MPFTRLVFPIVFSALTGCSPLVNKFSFFPDTTHTVSDRSLPGPIHKVIIKTADRVALSCFFIRNSKSKRLVIYFPGNAGNIDQRLSELIKFSNLGINVFGVGYRGFGRSTGKPSEKGIYKDGYAALIYAKDSLGFPADSIFVCGRSIGTTVAIEISQKINLSGVILITPLTTGKDMAKVMGLRWLSPFIGNPDSLFIEKILRYCELWKEPAPRPPPVKILGPPKIESGPALDYTYFDQNRV